MHYTNLREIGCSPDEESLCCEGVGVGMLGYRGVQGCQGVGGGGGAEGAAGGLVMILRHLPSRTSGTMYINNLMISVKLIKRFTS
jgi:hypothetical protein